MDAISTRHENNNQHVNSTRTVSCTCHSAAGDSFHHGVAYLNGHCGSLSSGLRDGFGGYVEERRHRQETRRHVLHSFC